MYTPVCFIATAWPYDPVELAEAIISEVQETGQSRTRSVFCPSFCPLLPPMPLLTPVPGGSQVHPANHTDDVYVPFAVGRPGRGAERQADRADLCELGRGERQDLPHGKPWRNFGKRIPDEPATASDENRD